MNKHLKYIRKEFLLVLLIIVVLFATSLTTKKEVNANDVSMESKRVLFISSYSSSFNTFFVQTQGLSDTFEGHQIVYDLEFMDSKRFYNDENLSNFYNLISYKLEETEYDLVIVSDDNALNFVMINREELFLDLPIIFFGINNVNNAALYSQNDLVTGVVEHVSISETIAVSLVLNDKATKVLAISDNTPTGLIDKNRFYQIQDEFPDLEFTGLDLSEISFEELELELESIGNDTIIILLAALTDVNGTTYDFDESLERIIHHSSQPVYHLFEHGIGDGIIGGKVVSHYVQAQYAANMALEYFSGTPFEYIELQDSSPNVYMFDYNVLQKYDIDDSLLPSSTILINKEITPFEEYKEYVLSTVIIFILLITLITLLVWSRRNRAISRLELIEVNKRLEVATQELKESNKELLFASENDLLTKVYNRNHFERQLTQLEDVNKYPISIILCDLNGLKLINDAFGHLLGDEALIKIARVLTEIFSKGIVSRIGGDEFAIIHIGVRKKHLIEMMKQVREETNKIVIQGIALSVSLGLAVKRNKAKTINELFSEAEDWMYREKLTKTDSNRNEIINTIISTLNAKDEYSESHSKRVSKISLEIGKLIGFDENKLNELETAGLLHDIGKIIVPSSILNKNGRLTDKEYEEIKKHSEIGYRVLFNVSTMRDIAEIVFCHHERPDGRGYPRGLKDDEIPVQAKIIAIADAIDTMLTDRVYRKKLTNKECFEEMQRNKGTQFDEAITDLVLRHFDSVASIVENSVKKGDE